MAVKKTTEAADAAATEQVPIQKADTAQSGAGFCVYIGPSITGVIQINTIYPGSKDAVLERDDVKLAVAQYPGISGLIVDGCNLNESLEKLKIRGEALCEAARAIAKKQ